MSVWVVYVIVSLAISLWKACRDQSVDRPWVRIIKHGCEGLRWPAALAKGMGGRCRRSRS